MILFSAQKLDISFIASEDAAAEKAFDKLYEKLEATGEIQGR